MDLLFKPKLLQNICAIEIDASASYLPAAEGALQPFANTFISDSNAVPVYFGKGSVSLAQQGQTTRSGMSWQQSLTIRFPNGDQFNSKRIEEYILAKFIYIKMSSSLVYLFGRNDFLQNTPLKVEIKNTEKLAQVVYKTESIFPIGLTNGSDQHQLPGDLPINFYNL